MEARLTAEFWVQAYLRRLQLSDIPAFVTKRGDATAGAVLVKLNTLDGNASVWQRSFNLMSGERAWVVLIDAAETDVDSAISKKNGFDPDIWVIEVEDRDGRHLLDQDGLT